MQTFLPTPWGLNVPYSFRQEERASWGRLVPQMTFVLLLCDAVRGRVGVEEVAEQAMLTYPRDFVTWINGRKVSIVAFL